MLPAGWLLTPGCGAGPGDCQRPAPRDGVLVGAVMKATRGQADAARVLELILQRLTGDG